VGKGTTEGCENGSTALLYRTVVPYRDGVKPKNGSIPALPGGSGSIFAGKCRKCRNAGISKKKKIDETPLLSID
jgi:hypothetical protein